MTPAACRTLAPVAVAGTWWRAVQLRHTATPLGYAHTATNPGRFNAGTATRPGVPVLYLAEDMLVAQFEVGALLGSLLPGHAVVPNPTAVGWSFVPVAVSLRAVADLTSHTELAKIDTSVQELTGDWQGYGHRPHVPALTTPYYSNTPTHRLGHELHRAGAFEGLLTFSAKLPTRRNLVVFPKRVRKGSSVSYTDPATGLSHSIP